MGVAFAYFDAYKLNTTSSKKFVPKMKTPSS